MSKHNPFAWIEIPVLDMKRAAAYYEVVLDCTIEIVEFGGILMGWFPSAGPEAPGATGSLIQQESYVPSHHGTLVYFSCEDVAQPLSKVAAAGGKVLQPKTMISQEHGFMGVMEDTEGNRVAFHSTH